jgi:dTMP kinase
MTRRGAFIVIEGLDRSGKTTQTELLAEHLATTTGGGLLSVSRRKFPGKKRASESTDIAPPHTLSLPDRTTGTGKLIDAYLNGSSDLDDRAIHLLFSANRWEAARALEAQLAAGTTVLCDRYAFSGVAFSAAKGLSLAWCRAPDVGLPAPDLTLFLDLAPEAAATRGGYGEERYEKEALQARVRTLFQSLGGETRGWVTIDAGQDREAVTREVWKHVEPLAQGIEATISKLWVDGDGSPSI